MKKHMVLVLAALTVIVTSASAWTTTYYVNPGESIQDAIDSSTHGDTVVVSPGTYYEIIFFNGKNIVLTSTDPDSPAVVASTVIYAYVFQWDDFDSASVVTFDGTESSECVISGFTLTNGGGNGGLGQRYGGGIYGRGTLAVVEHN